MKQRHSIEEWKEQILTFVKKHQADLVMAVVLAASVWAWTWQGAEAHQVDGNNVQAETVEVQKDKSKSEKEDTSESSASESTAKEAEAEVSKSDETENTSESNGDTAADAETKRKSKWDKELASSGTNDKSRTQADAAAAELEAQAAAAAAEAAIVDGQYPIMGTSTIAVEQMVAYFESMGAAYPAEALAAGGAPDIQTFCQIFYDEAIAEGIRPEVPFAQTMKETGWLQYGGDASISQFNFSGLGTTGGGVAGNSFPDVRTGVRAQMQHLKAYATADPLNQACVDSRYEYVSKGCAPYVEWLGQQENPQGAGWATGANYGPDIVSMIHAMKGM